MSVTYHARERFKVSKDAPLMAIGVPVRKSAAGCVEFWMSLFQLMPPLNVRVAYVIQKGMLPAAARNEILRSAIEQGTSYILFLDDDVLFPDVTALRLWAHMKTHPEAAAITGIYTTKFDPAEPLCYEDFGDGAFWNWQLGELREIHSAGAGCFMVDVARAAKLKPPWFQDAHEADSSGKVRESYTLGHDRYFMSRLREETGGKVYADTGLLLGHMDFETEKIYVVPPKAPCFQKPPKGEAFVPSVAPDGTIR